MKTEDVLHALLLGIPSARILQCICNSGIVIPENASPKPGRLIGVCLSATARRYTMSIATVETHPNVLSAAALIGDDWIQEGLPSRYAEGLYPESNKDLCRRLIQKVFNEGEVSLIRDFMSPDAVNHELGDSVGGEPPQGHNIE